MSEKEVAEDAKEERKFRTYKDLTDVERTDLQVVANSFLYFDQIHVVYLAKKDTPTALTSKADIEGMLSPFGELHLTYQGVRQAFIDRAPDGLPRHQAE